AWVDCTHCGVSHWLAVLACPHGWPLSGCPPWGCWFGSDWPHCCQSFPCGPYPWLMSLLVVVVDAAAPPNRLSVPGRNSGNHLVAVQRLSLSAAAARAGRRRSPPAPTARTAAAGEARRRPSPRRG